MEVKMLKGCNRYRPYDVRGLMTAFLMKRGDFRVLRQVLRLAEMRPRPWHHFRSEHDLSEEGCVGVFKLVCDPQVHQRRSFVPEVDAVQYAAIHPDRDLPRQFPRGKSDEAHI
jgi:hypothetical protein